MYDPVKDGIGKEVRSVDYTEVEPPGDLAELVHRFWELKTDSVPADSFSLHVVPDACVNIMFNLIDVRIAAVTARATTYVELSLGKMFHYAGIQFLPGVWKGERDEITDGFVDSPYQGRLPLVETGNELAEPDFPDKQSVLSELVRRLVKNGPVARNIVTAKILSGIDDIRTVVDMAAVADLSPRQLQRILKRTTGFSPYDLLKVLRLQHSFRGHYLDFFADRSHFIHSFRKIMGYTPAEYFKNFDV
jgi:AraC-like DNA-binding protein